MRLLFEMDRKNYDPAGKVLARPSVRGIVIQNNKIAMVYSEKYHYYKFPGGGAEAEETHLATLVRETAEEAGLQVIPESVSPYGYVRRAEKGVPGGIFLQENYYYLCSAAEKTECQRLDSYEAEAGFTLEWVKAERAIEVNRNMDHGPTDQTMLEREARVLELLLEEGLLSKQQKDGAQGCYEGKVKGMPLCSKNIKGI